MIVSYRNMLRASASIVKGRVASTNAACLRHVSSLPYKQSQHRPRHNSPRDIDSTNCTACGCLPFGRNILDSSVIVHEEAQEQVHDTNNAGGKSRRTQCNAYALFLALLIDQISNNPENPAHQAMQLQAVNKLLVARQLWNYLQPLQKETFYAHITPLALTLSERSSQTTSLLKAVTDLILTLSAQQQTAIQDILNAAALHCQALLSTSSDKPVKQRPSSDSPVTDLQRTIIRDEQDISALQYTLQAAGMSDFMDAESMATATLRVTNKATGSIAETDIQLVTRLRPGSKSLLDAFANKCQLAWDVFFPGSQAMSSADAMRSRLQLVLVSDRFDLDLPTVMQIRNQSLGAMESNGWDSLSELELQIATVKGSGEQVKVSLPLSQIPFPFTIRNADEYDYENGDEADYDFYLDGSKTTLPVATQTKVNGPGRLASKALIPRLCSAQSSSHETASTQADLQEEVQRMRLGRRELLASVATASLLAPLVAPEPSVAVQGLTAGRIPGLSTQADENGFYQYTRPEGKSGGHGVGWSEIPQYDFKVPAGWNEIPVSIADLGGTEIDLRYQSRDQGDIAVVVAPILRFADIGFNANVTIEMLGSPEKIIKGFGPELFGKPLEDEDLVETTTGEKDGLTYYSWRLKPFRLVSATATGNRIFILSLQSNARQWRKHEADLRRIVSSFHVNKA